MYTPLAHCTIKIISLFCRNPTPETKTWTPFTETDRNCFIIGKDNTCTNINGADNIRLLEQIYEETNFDE